MDHKKIDLQEPIYELQKGETPRQHYFIDLFYQVDDDNITNFAESFCGLKKGQEWVYGGSSEKLLFDPYTPTYISKLFGCLQALTRRDAYWKSIFKSKQDARQKKIIDFMDTFADDIIESTSDLKVTESEINYDDSRPHLKAQGKHYVSNARRTNWEILKDLGDIEDRTQKHKVEAENHMHYESVDNLLEAFHASKAEWNQHKKP